MASTIPASTRISLHQRLEDHARQRWGGLAEVKMRFRFAYLDGELHTGEVLGLCRLRYASSASLWGFAIHLAGRDGYEESVLPSGPHQPIPDHARTSIRQHLSPRQSNGAMPLLRFRW